MFESPKSGFSASSDGEMVPSIAVSRSKIISINFLEYLNSSVHDEGNVFVEHSYHSSIKNPKERPHNHSLSNLEVPKTDQK